MKQSVSGSYQRAASQNFSLKSDPAIAKDVAMLRSLTKMNHFDEAGPKARRKYPLYKLY